jgi:succinate dehydrogenase / fumarate reductase cytochrome b subunit
MWQRTTGIITLLFILYHVWQFRFTAFWSTHANADFVGSTFAQPLIFLFYVIGVTGAAFHFGNGIWTFLITWGITIGERSQRISQIVTTAVSIALSATGIGLAVAFVVIAGGFKL